MVHLRALRRHHRQRLKNKRSRYFAAESRSQRSVGTVLETPCQCSCYLCGNQRVYHGENMQERRARLRFTD